MKTSTKITLLAILGLVLGVSLVCFGLIFDPFSLPFQDFDQMPLETQQAYESRSAIAQSAQWVGGGIAIVALFAIPTMWLAGRRKMKE
jgi:hypothetical protein